MTSFTIWRHPKPRGAQGRCIGSGTDLPVDPRKSKRLAHRIRTHARRHGLPREVVTSPLARAADVGRWLKRWGFRWRVDAALVEADFGRWDGRPWSDISQAEFDRWMADFCGFDFEGGESITALLRRACDWRPPPECHLAVGHSGWMVARHWGEQNKPVAPSAQDWPQPFRYAQAKTFKSAEP
jgi:alpha-ribazole phosphatase